MPCEAAKLRSRKQRGYLLSLGTYACLFDDPGPPGSVLFHESRERFGRAACGIEPQDSHAFLHVREFQRAIQRGIEFRYERFWCLPVARA